jgi:hypothetical protein
VIFIGNPQSAFLAKAGDAGLQRQVEAVLRGDAASHSLDCQAAESLSRIQTG